MNWKPVILILLALASWMLLLAGVIAVVHALQDIAQAIRR